MDKLRCIAIDDEPFACEIISEDIQKIDFLDLRGTFHNPADALTQIASGKTDLVFLDIQMPGITGTQFLRTLQKPPMIIFTTAYEQYALEGFELDVVDYLLKPIPFPRFKQAADKALNLYQLTQKAQRGPANDFLIVFSEYQKLKIPYEDILYIEGMKDYVKIFIKNKPKPILTRMNLKGMESKLSDERFCRVHQSYIVPLGKITSFLKSRLFIGSLEIPVGEKFADRFLKMQEGS